MNFCVCICNRLLKKLEYENVKRNIIVDYAKQGSLHDSR